jgi:small GTP-binding protein
MDCRAAVLTGEGTAALATLMVAGSDSARILGSLSSAALPEPGKLAVLDIEDSRGRIDQVGVGQEAPGRFALHCHGNPLIVERIMACLKARGAKLVEGRDLLSERGSLLASEIDQALALTRTLHGAAFLSRQRERGLLPELRRWLDAPPPLSTLRQRSRDWLTRYEPARTLIRGCRVVLAGPPNSGKSTLFNRLLGVEKSIVTDIEGTTRDWVDGHLRLSDLHLHLLDTPGLDTRLTRQADGHLDRAAQEQVHTLLAEADFHLLVLDASRPAPSLDLGSLPVQRTLVALNKCDRPVRLARDAYRRFPQVCRISAREDIGLTDLIAALRKLSGVADLNITLPAPFTSRQQALLASLSAATDAATAERIVRALLHGQ